MSDYISKMPNRRAYKGELKRVHADALRDLLGYVAPFSLRPPGCTPQDEELARRITSVLIDALPTLGSITSCCCLDELNDWGDVCNELQTGINDFYANVEAIVMESNRGISGQAPDCSAEGAP